MVLLNAAPLLLTWLSIAALGHGLEITSFRENCEVLDRECDPSNGIYYYAPGFEDGGPVMVFPRYSYNMTFTGADPDAPVRISWHFDMLGEYKGDQAYATPPEMLRWDYNVSAGEGSYLWEPAVILTDDFPTPWTNLTGEEALGVAGVYRWSYLAVSQPESDDEEQRKFCWSYPLTLQTDMVEDFLMGQREQGRIDEAHVWRLGVGIGVGLGVPALLAVAFFFGYKSGVGSPKRAAVGGKGEHRVDGQ